MHCTFCEAILEPGTRYCPQCGTIVEDPKAAYGHHDQKADPYATPRAEVFAPALPYVPPAPQVTSNLAVISLVAGIAAWFPLPIIGAIAAVITGHMARREIRDSGGRVGGDALALIGLILGYAQLLIAVVALLVVAVILIALALAAKHG